MIIRKAELYDLPGAYKLTERFHEQDLEGYTLGHNPESARDAVKVFITEAVGVVAVQYDDIIGCLGGFITPFLLNSESIVFQEIMWYVRPDKRQTGVGIKMLSKTMEIVKELGATHIVMAHTGNNTTKLSQLYTKMGFEVLETQYIRGLE